MAREDILGLNAYLKFVEFVLHCVDTMPDDANIGSVRADFREKFSDQLRPLLSQNFGLIRLIPLMYMVEDNFLTGTEDGNMIKAIRNSFAHNSFSCNQHGYIFMPNRSTGQSVTLSYAEFAPFIHRIENAFHSNPS